MKFGKLPNFFISFPSCSKQRNLSESSGFAFGLEEGEDVALANGALHVPDDLTRSLSQELDLDLKSGWNFLTDKNFKVKN